jgi:hypothetical protein
MGSGPLFSSIQENDQRDALEWNEGGIMPDRVGADAVNQWLFNIDTVDNVLAHVMLHGQKWRAASRSAIPSFLPRTKPMPISLPNGSMPIVPIILELSPSNIHHKLGEQQHLHVET